MLDVQFQSDMEINLFWSSEKRISPNRRTWDSFPKESEALILIETEKGIKFGIFFENGLTSLLFGN